MFCSETRDVVRRNSELVEVKLASADLGFGGVGSMDSMDPSGISRNISLLTFYDFWIHSSFHLFIALVCFSYRYQDAILPQKSPASLVANAPASNALIALELVRMLAVFASSSVDKSATRLTIPGQALSAADGCGHSIRGLSRFQNQTRNLLQRRLGLKNETMPVADLQSTELSSSKSSWLLQALKDLPCQVCVEVVGKFRQFLLGNMLFAATLHETFEG